MFGSVTLALVMLIVVIISLIIKRNSKNRPPGPFSWPVVGNMFLLRRLQRELGGQCIVFAELSKRYGSDIISLDVGASKMMVVSGKLVDVVLKNDEFVGRPWNEFIKIRNMGKKQGITMNDGADWSDLRNWTVRTMKYFGFGKREMSDMIKEELIVLIDNLSKQGPHSMKIVVTKAVVNVLWSLATGKRFTDEEKLNYFIQLMERRSEAFDMIGGLVTSFPWLRHIAPQLTGYNILQTLNSEFKNYFMEMIHEHRKNYKPGQESDLIDMFIHEMTDNKNNSSVFTEEQLMMVLIDLFIAGSTTTSTSLDFLFLFLTVHQDIQKKIHEEIDSVIPRDRYPEAKDRENLPYVDAVMTESQRLWPVFPIIGPRRVIEDTVLDNYSIPKNSTILINTYSLSIDPKIFPEPQKFKPERHLKNGVYEPNANIIQFGKGKRRCPGEILARSALFLVLVGVLQKYTLLPVPGQGPYSVEVIFGLTTVPKPYKLLAVPR
ncbi:putative cytochrome P450 305a1 [Xylocopa sonorina]|uniref:putative cytochrome P450 305a1 n=1 Tax=Xylocopa sonorina TaxID=1818115 RepID=UPI00403AF444